jgi:hypothetical protein
VGSLLPVGYGRIFFGVGDLAEDNAMGPEGTMYFCPRLFNDTEIHRGSGRFTEGMGMGWNLRKGKIRKKRAGFHKISNGLKNGLRQRIQ